MFLLLDLTPQASQADTNDATEYETYAQMRAGLGVMFEEEKFVELMERKKAKRAVYGHGA